jgi:hypothetical protein
MKIDELKSYREPTGGVVVNNSPYSTKYVIDFLLSELAAEVKRREEVERYALQIADDLNTALSEDDDDLKAAESALAEAERRGMESEIEAVCEFVKAYEKKKFEIMHQCGELLSICGFMLDYCTGLRDAAIRAEVEP